MRFSTLFCCFLCCKKRKDLSIINLHKENKKISKIPLFIKNNDFNHKTNKSSPFNVKDTTIISSFVKNNCSPNISPNTSPIIQPLNNNLLNRNIYLPPLEIADLGDSTLFNEPDPHSNSETSTEEDPLTQSTLEGIVNEIYNNPNPSQSLLILRNMIDNDSLKENKLEYENSFSNSDEDPPMEEIRLHSPQTEIRNYMFEKEIGSKRRKSNISEEDKFELEREGYDVMSDVESPIY